HARGSDWGSVFVKEVSGVGSLRCIRWPFAVVDRAPSLTYTSGMTTGTWVLALACCGLLGAADRVGEKPPSNFNIPLWDAGKVPQAQGNGPLDSPFLTVFQPPV